MDQGIVPEVGSPDAGGPEAIVDAPRAEPPERLPRSRDPEGWIEPLFTPAEEEEEGPNGAVLFTPDEFQEIALELTAADIDSLRLEPETEVAGQLGWKGETYTVAVRLKGSSSFLPIDEKPSFKIDVHAYDKEQELDGLERLTLNNMKQDGSMLRESTYYWLAARVGIPAPRFTYARVTLNGEDYGLYGLVETLDEQFLKRAFPDDPDGNLYEAEPADFTHDRDWFHLEEDGGVAPVWDDLEELVDDVDDHRSTGFDAMFGERFDRSVVLDYLALDMLVGNRDGYVYNFHNHLPYHMPLADRWVIVPWGTDQAFRHTAPPLGDAEKPAEGQLFVSCWDDPTCGPELRARALAILDIWEAELPDRVEQVRALVEPECDTDRRREKSCTPEDVEDYVGARVDYLRPYL